MVTRTLQDFLIYACAGTVIFRKICGGQVRDTALVEGWTNVERKASATDLRSQTPHQPCPRGGCILRHNSGTTPTTSRSEGGQLIFIRSCRPNMLATKDLTSDTTAAKLLNFAQLRILGLQHQRYQNSIREYFSSAYNPNKFRP